MSMNSSLAATVLERTFRGHVGRNDRRSRRKARDHARLAGLRNYFAVQVQKTFRGYFSRKYKKDHGRRKRYLQGVEAKGNEVRETLRKYAEDQQEYERKKKEEDFNKEVNKLTKGLHHLVSTKQIAGVFNPNENYMNVRRSFLFARHLFMPSATGSEDKGHTCGGSFATRNQRPIENERRL